MGSTGDSNPFKEYSGMRSTKVDRGRNTEKLNHTVDLSGSTIKSPKSKHLSFFGIHESEVQVKPKLLESKLAQKPEFMGLSDGFKRSFGNDTLEQKQFKIPVVGYTGHRKGEKSENMIGQNYRATTIATKVNERRVQASKTFYVGRHVSQV